MKPNLETIAEAIRHNKDKPELQYALIELYIATKGYLEREKYIKEEERR